MNEGLVKDIRDIKEMLIKHLHEDAARAERELSIRKDVDELLHSVNGNSKPGLKTTVELLQRDMARVYWLGGVIVMALIGNIIATLWK